MSVEQISEVGEAEWPMESDVPSLACQAAIELDNILLDRPCGTDSVCRLARIISRSIPDEQDPSSANWLLDPTAVVVVNRAIGDSTRRQPFSTVKELVREAGELVQRFHKLIDDSEGFKKKNSDDLKKMRAFCLALSRRASAAKKSPHDRVPDHPFRRLQGF